MRPLSDIETQSVLDHMQQAKNSYTIKNSDHLPKWLFKRLENIGKKRFGLDFTDKTLEESKKMLLDKFVEHKYVIKKLKYSEGIYLLENGSDPGLDVIFQKGIEGGRKTRKNRKSKKTKRNKRNKKNK